MENLNNLPERIDEERLLKAIFEEEPEVAEAKRKASEWLATHTPTLNAVDVVCAVEVAQDLLAADFEKWEEMDDDEKDDLAEMMCGLMVARDIVADYFGMKTKGRLIEEEEDEE